MRSSINWALLGLVIQRPSYGYELVQRFERIYGDALELSSPSQIYTGLDSLERRSLIELEPAGEVTVGATRQPKPNYRATAEGMRDYREWLISQVHQDRRRSRLFALQLAQLAPADALAVLDRCERACLAEVPNMLAAPAGDVAEGMRGLLDRLVLEDDRLALDTRLAWIQYARTQLNSLASSTRSTAR